MLLDNGNFSPCRSLCQENSYKWILKTECNKEFLLPGTYSKLESVVIVCSHVNLHFETE